jgi:hypothetical protein
MQKGIWFVIVLMVISITFTSRVIAEEVSLNSPENVEIDEEFTVEIDSAVEETCDVKIFIHNSDDSRISRSEYISEIYSEADDTWKDSWFYIIGSFPEQKEYKLKVASSSGQREICVKLRKSSDKESGFDQVCRDIEINEKSTSSESKPKEKTPEETKESPEEKSSIPETQQNSEMRKISYIEKQEKLTLNPKSNSAPITEIKTPRKELYILYSFMAFCVAIIILLVLKKL